MYRRIHGMLKEHCTIFPVYGDDDADGGSDVEWQIEMGVRIFIADNNWHQSIYDENTNLMSRACLRALSLPLCVCFCERMYAYLGSQLIHVNIFKRTQQKWARPCTHKRQSRTVSARDREKPCEKLCWNNKWCKRIKLTNGNKSSKRR